MANPDLTAPDFYRHIVQGTTEYAMYFLDPQGNIQSWNPGAEKLFGYKAAEILGMPYSMLYRNEDRESGAPEAELRNAEVSGQASGTHWLVRQSGAAFWAEAATAVIRDATGSVTGFAKVARDASERQRLQQALERSQDELQRFAFTISHDLQEPLRTVRNYAELLARRYKGKLDADADDFIAFIVDGTGRMGQLLKDILAYSQAGREDKTRLEPTQAATVLQWALMNVDGMAKQTGASITWDEMPEVLADQMQLTSLFQHLLTNSIKFRSQEPPSIHISAHREGELWEFNVRDNGIGIEPQYAERVFGIFKRLVGRDVPGTGIGLAIARKIVQAHGGRIWIESADGKGASVRFTLPAYG